MLPLLLKAQYYYSTGQVGNTSASSIFNIIGLLLFCRAVLSLSSSMMFQVGLGVPYLCEVLKEVNEQRQSKSWYLLRARALQTCSSYLSLDTAALPQAERGRITEHGKHKSFLHFNSWLCVYIFHDVCSFN